MFGHTRSFIVGGTLAAAVGGYVIIMASGWPTSVWSGLDLVPQLNGEWVFNSDCFWMFFTSLFAIMNPLVAIPFFVSLTEGRTASSRKRMGIATSITVLIALVTAAVLGRDILAFFAISIGSFRIAGGIIVLLMGLSLLRSEGVAGGGSDAGASGTEGDSGAICPLAIPLLAGPGAIATIIIRCEEATGACEFITIAAVIAAMVVITYVILRAAVPLAKALGPSGLTVVTRLMGMIVAAIAIDMLVIGVQLQFPGLGG
jgi:multiple antibiotic resistance protein